MLLRGLVCWAGWASRPPRAPSSSMESCPLRRVSKGSDSSHGFAVSLLWRHKAVLVLEGREATPDSCLFWPHCLGKDLPQNRGTRHQPGHAPKSSGGSGLCSPISWVHFLPIFRVVLAYNKLSLNQCWLSSPCPATAAQRPCWWSLQETGSPSVGTSLCTSWGTSVRVKEVILVSFPRVLLLTPSAWPSCPTLCSSSHPCPSWAFNGL